MTQIPITSDESQAVSGSLEESESEKTTESIEAGKRKSQPIRMAVFAMFAILFWLSAFAFGAYWLRLGPVFARELGLAVLAAALAPPCFWIGWKLVMNWFKQFMISSALVLLVLLAGSIWVMLEGGKRWDHEVSRLNEFNGVVAMSRMVPSAIAPESNAALIYMDVQDRMPTTTAVETIMLSDLEEIADLGMLRPMLVKSRPMLEVGRKASSLTHCIWPHDYSNYETLNFSAMSSATDVAGRLAAHALLLAEEDDLKGAVRDLEAGLRISEHIAQDPFLTSKLRHLSAQRALITTFRLIFSTRAIPKESRIEEYLIQTDHVEHMKQAILSEIPLNLSRFNEHQNILLLRKLWFGDGAVKMDLSTYIDRMIFATRQIQKPITVFRAEGRVPRPPRWAVLSGMLQTDYGAFRRKVGFGEADTQLALAAIRLRRFKDKNGKYPDQLKELGVEPNDPWTSEPFEYRREGDGFVLRSKGGGKDSDRVEWKWER